MKYLVTFNPRKDRLKQLIFKNKKVAEQQAKYIRLAGAKNVRVKVFKK
ncbi:MAG: hypothetical protein KAJ49_05970 [Arcobacteraceae bacterium]|nr:hypothetical protein [Arcobacteraceae bacterium]